MTSKAKRRESAQITLGSGKERQGNITKGKRKEKKGNIKSFAAEKFGKSPGQLCQF